MHITLANCVLAIYVSLRPAYVDFAFLKASNTDVPRKVLQGILLFVVLPAVAIIALFLTVLALYHWIVVLRGGSTTYEHVKHKLSGYQVDPRNPREHYSCCKALLKMWHRCRPFNSCRRKLFQPQDTP